MECSSVRSMTVTTEVSPPTLPHLPSSGDPSFSSSVLAALVNGDADDFVSTVNPESNTPPFRNDRASSEIVQTPDDTRQIEVDDGFISLGEKGLPVIGTRRGLVRRLLTGAGDFVIDFHYRKAFLTSYRAFTTADELLQLLFEEFQYIASLASNTEQRSNLNHSVIALLRLWLDENHIEPHNKILLEKMRRFVVNFANSFQESSVFQTTTQGLIEHIDTHINQLLSPPLILSTSTSADLTTAKRSLNISPSLLAKALTKLTSSHYQKIRETDYFDWLEDPNVSNAVSLFIAEERKVCFWALRTVLRPYHSSQRRENMKYFLDVVQACVDSGNFSSACSLLNGLTCTAITELKRTYSGLSRNKRRQFDDNSKLIDLTDNFKFYRTKLGTKRDKCVPWLQIHLHDLKMRHRGHPIFVDEHGRRGLINFDRCHRIHMFIEELSSYNPVMGIHADHSDITITANLVVKQLNEFIIGTDLREWLQKRSQALKLEEQMDFHEFREELGAAGMWVPPRISSAHSASSTLLSGTETMAEKNKNIDGIAEPPSIFPDDVFDTNSAHCLNGRITDVSGYAEAHGGFSDIFTGYLDGTRVAIKVIRRFDSDGIPIEHERLLRRLRREYMSWTWVKHDIVLQCLGFAYDVGPEPYGLPRLISPWMSGGTLSHYMNARPGLERLKALVDIAEGLAYLHDYIPPIVHGDIRGGNILMADDGRPCLSDFGLAKVLKEGGMTVTGGLVGTIRWMSPELLKDGVFPSTESDVWAYAMTILEIMSGRYPYADTLNVPTVLSMISGGELPTRPKMSLKAELSDEIWAVCQKCWNIIPRQRPSMREVHNELRSLLLSASHL